VSGRVEAIHVAGEKGAPPEPRDQVTVVAGRGIEGDRYFRAEGDGTFYEPGKKGQDLTTDAAAADLSAGDLDVLVIAGGFGPDKLRTDEGVKALVRGMDEQGKPIGFICHAGWVPISAGIVEGRRVTSVPAIADDLRNAGAQWEDAEVVVDANFVTSRRPPDLPAFMRALIGVAVGAEEPAAL